MDDKEVKKSFTEAEQQLLSGLSGKIAKKHRCSSTYVQHIINGKRATKNEKAQKILKDLNALLALLSPET